MVVCTREFLLLGHVASFSKAEGLDKNGLYLFYYISISEKREGGGGLAGRQPFATQCHITFGINLISRMQSPSFGSDTEL